MYQPNFHKVEATLHGALCVEQIIGFIPDEADINSAQWSLELINVPDGHTCEPA